MYYYDSRAVATEVTISEGLEPIHNSFAAL